MKRLNPATGKEYVWGEKEIRNNKIMIFKSYSLNNDRKYKTGNKKGYFKENWVSEEAFKKEKQNRKPSPRAKVYAKNYRDNQAELINVFKPPRRINPLTGREFARGDYDPETDKYFETYRNKRIMNGYVAERWEPLDKFIRSNFAHLCRHTRKRAKEQNVPHNIDIDYLMSIFPKDSKCPVFKTKFSWGLDFVSNKDGMKERIAPSVDKIIPKKGYVKGNVAFISIKANGIKSDATPKEVIKVAKWLEEIS